MNYKEIENLIKQNRLGTLEDRYAEVFDRITAYVELFTQGTIDNYFETDRALKELTGLFISLLIPCTILDSRREFSKLSHLDRMKKEKITMGEKISGTNLMVKEADLSVYDYTRLKDIFFTHQVACDKAISVCQSSLKFMSKEKYQ